MPEVMADMYAALFIDCFHTIPQFPLCPGTICGCTSADANTSTQKAWPERHRSNDMQ